MAREENLRPILDSILNHVCSSLTVPVGRAHLAPGNNVAWDDCCNGQLYVRVVSIIGESSLSKPAMQPCAQIYQMRVAIGVMRCAHTVNDQGIPPTVEELNCDTYDTLRDRFDVMKALVCRVPGIRGVSALRIEDWMLQGPQGGCVGGEITIRFNVDACVTCEE